MDDLVKKYLQEKYGNNYDDEAQKKYDDSKSSINIGSAISSFGDAIAGNKIGSSDEYFNQLKKQAKEDTVGKIENDKKSYMANAEFNNKQADFDPSSSRSLAFRNTLKNQFPTLANAYGADFDKISAGDMENIMNPLRLKENVEARKEAARLANAGRIDAREDRNYERQQKRDEKLEERDKTLAVPGYVRTGEVLPKAEEAVKFRKATATSNELSNKLNRMRELVKQNGSFEWGGEAGTEMESLATEIQMLGKSPELYELGVLAGPDLSLLQKITADPSSMSSLFTRDSSRNKQIDSQLSSLQNKLKTTGASMGYKKANELPAGKTIVKTQVNQKTGQTRVVYSDGSVEIQQKQVGQ